MAIFFFYLIVLYFLVLVHGTGSIIICQMELGVDLYIYKTIYLDFRDGNLQVLN